MEQFCRWGLFVMMLKWEHAHPPVPMTDDPTPIFVPVIDSLDKALAAVHRDFYNSDFDTNDWKNRSFKKRGSKQKEPISHRTRSKHVETRSDEEEAGEEDDANEEDGEEEEEEEEEQPGSQKHEEADGMSRVNPFPPFATLYRVCKDAHMSA